MVAKDGGSVTHDMSPSRRKSNKVRPVFRALAGLLALMYIPVLLISPFAEPFSYRFHIAGGFWAAFFLFVAVTGRGPSWLR